MRIMCTIVASVLACTLVLLSIVFIGATSRLEDGQRAESLQKREANSRAGIWELLSAATVVPEGPVDMMMRFDDMKRSNADEQDPLEAENSHVVVQVYSVPDSEQDAGNESTGMPIRTLKVENFGTSPKEQMDGRSTDHVERKVFAPARNIQEQLAKMESSERSGNEEELLQERFFIDDSATNVESSPPTRRRFDRLEHDNLPPVSQAIPPFFDYNEQTSQRMLDEFFALRNQDSMAARRSNYDWGEGQLRSRTLEEIKNQNRALAASRKKAPLDYAPTQSRDDDMSYDRYADYAEADQRAVSYGAKKLGRKQRATPSTGGHTHVLNKVPIVAYDGDGSMAPMYKADGSQRSQFERSRFHYSLPSMVFNPYAWDPYHLNMLRFPQCSACQQNARALCSTCGMCADCCAHSKCTCGCLNG
uniref:Uncharacterized protein n=1 Tax=Anopheles dirus TaxID=7168 RepID=A0A182MZ59_9DIPT